MEWTIKKDLWKVLLVILAFAALMAAPPVQASYEVSNFNMFSAPATGTPSKWTNNLEIRWTAPTMASGYTFQRYIYLWNNVATAMTDTNFSPSTTGAVGTTETAATKQASDLTAKDYSLNPGDDVLYLHVKTEYLETSTSKVLYSTDMVLGPFQIDNVAPSGGTVRITDDSGTTITSTSSSILNVKLAASGSIAKYYLSESEFTSGDGVSPFATDIVWNMQNTATGSHTLYAWFEDAAGNKSATPSTVTFTLLGAVSIKPYTATIDLSVATQTFIVDGTTASYTWSITDSTPETTGQTVAEITGSATGNSVTVTARNKGTFTMTATPSAGAALKSGTITVAQSAKTVNIALSVGWNLISIPVLPSNTAIATVLSGIAGKYSIVWGEFNPTTTAWKNYNPTKGTNSLTVMEPNKGYWINVTEACTLTVSGSAATTKGGSLGAGWNLIGFAGDADTAAITTVLTGIAGKYSIVWGEFNPTTTAWKNYNPTKGTNSLTTMGAGKGYWINMTEGATLSY
jgi:hypothetical protein